MLSKLDKALEPIFKLEPMRNDKYYPEVQKLYDALAKYRQEQDQNTFAELLASIKASMPLLMQRWKARTINFKAITSAMEELAKTQHQLPSIDWETTAKKSSTTLGFQFSAHNHARKEDSLKAWVAKKTGKPFTELSKGELTQIFVEYCGKNRLHQRINAHLEQEDSKLLFDIIMDHVEYFIKISGSRINLHLTDQELMTGFIEHAAELLVLKLNEVLSHGRSFSTLVRNAQAKSIFDNSVLSQIYGEGTDATNGMEP